MIVVLTVGDVYNISNKNQFSNKSVKYLLVYTKNLTYLFHFQRKLALSITEAPKNIQFYIFFTGFENESGF